MFYELKGLQYDGDGAVDGLYFLLETQAGVVSAPVRDKNAEDLHISWQPDSYPEPTTMEEVIDRVRRVSGIFWFEQSLRRKSSYTFGWTIRVLNGDALTAWDFDNMYPTPETRQHVNGNQLDSKIEYLARLAWLPMQKLEMKLKFLPGSNSRPRLRYFDLRDKPAIPAEQLITPKTIVVEGKPVPKQILQTFPRMDTNSCEKSTQNGRPILRLNVLRSIPCARKKTAAGNFPSTIPSWALITRLMLL